MVNYCDGITCYNDGVCRPLFLNYTCECLGTSFSGRHCEYVSTLLYIRRTVSRSLGYIAAIALTVVAGFVIVMDTLKYLFGIDPTKPELERIRRLRAWKRMKPKRQLRIAQRYIYVHEPAQRPSTITIVEDNPNPIETTA